MTKKMLSIILSGLLLCSCASSEEETTTYETTHETSITTPKETTTITTTTKITTTIDYAPVAEQLAKDLYYELNNSYDKCNIYTTCMSDAFQIASSDNLYEYTIEEFCQKYDIPYDFVYDLCINSYNSYIENYPTAELSFDLFTQWFVHYYAKHVFPIYFKEIDLYGEIQTSLDTSKQIIKEITSLDTDLPYLDNLTKYYSKLNSYNSLLNNYDITYEQYFNSANELKIEIEEIRAELDIYI